ncbi:methyltransferase [Actinospica sp.]|jgi:SAM-dependent methyltransferase|uniref:methyltransferase n=1 Tax=Actinospica sp. TaxID=1872142 RepID=UPI002C427655|nr:methyltransferase [Actinospica sp.]HWG24407.1 methyltransferase [Actinospica sp.]
MTDPSGFGSGSRLTFNSPLSDARADRLVADLAAQRPETVTDFGCGWGELLLRILQAAPQARGTGVDVHGPDVQRARRAAVERGLEHRATFVEAPAAEHLRPVDLVISSGAYQAFGTIPDALKAIRPIVNPGGRLLFGCEVWERTPTSEELAAMWPGTTIEDCLFLPDLVDHAVASGFRPLEIGMATRDEWDRFESGFAAGAEEWLLANSDHDEAEAVRARLDAHRTIWLRGSRQVMGYAYLTLGPDPRTDDGPGGG